MFNIYVLADKQERYIFNIYGSRHTGDICLIFMYLQTNRKDICLIFKVADTQEILYMFNIYVLADKQERYRDNISGQAEMLDYWKIYCRIIMYTV